ncbi:bifunctional tetrahydrofolate synthase/dihydrofolate synthase [Proteus sp. G2671]|uniref:bifunctional tetrahydrofolate synthase/dihydrofolate synthase n=1 Tax=Proteus sp. G2671 TaxID=2698883 RepID=UPI001377C4B0|nr:bifunctional tetrahydrofolate synthase/dihydrofolate synthase [Proteus sp. G2671]NBM04796.1 bifunctional tetrahydrofolate synthase/dihydrofolate synthase [Proteus sp. G2671]
MSNIITAPKATSPLSVWLSYLEHLHSSAIDMGLERVGKVGKILNVLRPAPKVITVSGTNGKGTTCHMLESILMASGLKVGVYSSPHLVRYTERVRIQGKELSEGAFCEVFAEIEQARGDISLTFFEYGTLAALKLFQQAQLDVVILEVGLGGRLDATNIVDADIAAITSIALDHTDWLGADREHIGHEKAGIFRANHYAVVGEPDMPHSIAQVANEKHAKLFRRGTDWSFAIEDEHWHWRCVDCEFDALPIPNIPLANAATAMGVICCLLRSDDKVSQAITEQSIVEGMSHAQLPGRFQVISQHPLVIFDVAHNPHAAGYLAEKLSQLPQKSDTQMRIVVGMLGDKDIAGTLACLTPLADHWYVAPLNEFRGASAEVLAQHLDKPMVFDSVENAWQQAISDAAPNDIVVVCGSFHTVAHIMELLEKESVGGK